MNRTSSLAAALVAGALIGAGGGAATYAALAPSVGSPGTELEFAL